MFIIRSYNRPEQCKRLMGQLRATDMTEPGILFVNGMEHESINKAYENIDLPENWKRVWQHRNIGCNAPLNLVFRNYPDESYYAAIDDDEWVETKGWDKELVKSAGKVSIANANDGWQSKERLQSFVCIGGDLVRALGWHVLPGLFHWYGEQVWEELDQKCGLRVWREDIKTEHRHWVNGKAQKDSTYKSQDLHRDHDGWIFSQWKKHQFADDIKKIMGLKNV